ncbi:MAG: cobyric acid synthase [Nitrospinae bacterium]|jgi:adenosylcobyric acid synthase|nr:cobyric acid synthase [Nitrospinota bacterium]MDA1109139.1 cobyric acid synthase [Nitrospinota bacterium]
MTAKTLMIQGTGSGVGKSIITAGFCRQFFLEGWKVAPFKAQNMSLNSFVTEEGGELGRAQAYQAEACGIKPHVNMNPILLKPSGDNMSQVIVMGKVTENRNAKNYYSHHNKHKEEVQTAFNHLSREYELVVLEGAGSPAEINLKQWDLVNMPMAKMAKAPVLIVGDIDRGGVFAWMKGTYDLLTKEEQDRVAGFIVNKFRGDLDLLTPGLRQFEDLVQKPILGVIPFCRDLFVDEEDAIPAWNHPSTENGKDQLDAAVIWYPRISNFTDVSPLAADPSVSLRYVSNPSQLGNPDLIILPGSKNTLDDLKFIKANGLAKAVCTRYESGAILLGICGGFQILGKTVKDPESMESRQAEISGLSVFNIETTLLKEKTTRQVRQTTLASPVFKEGLSVEGYEIHMGVTEFNEEYLPLFNISNGDHPHHLGVTNEKGTVVGTYIHGVLDNELLRNSFLNHVRILRGLPTPHKKFNYQEFRQQHLNRLAKLVNDSIDMKQVKEIVDGAW